MPKLSTRKKLAYSLVLCLLLWGFVELICLGGLFALDRYKGIRYTPARGEVFERKHRRSLEVHLKDKSPYMTHDSVLGWTIRPHGSRGGYRADGGGIRGNREHALTPPPGKVRVAAFGDSFTHATSVPNGATWQDQVERILPGVEVLNFGVPAYGLDQAFLRYRELGVRYHPHVVFMGFMSENIKRGVNTFRPFYFPQSGMPFAKPRFEVHRGKLVLIPNPMPSLADYRELLRDPEKVLPRLGEHDDYYRRRSHPSRFDFLPSVRFAEVMEERFREPVKQDGVYNTSSDAYRVALATFEEFAREARGNGSLPIAVFFPERGDIRTHREGNPASYSPLRADLEARGIRVIDLLGAFDRYDPEGTLANSHFAHYPREGNVMVGSYIRDVLVEQGLDRLAGVEKALAAR